MKPNLASTIIIRGAREHNLKNIDVDIPKNSFVVITGLSGSGKSSLAFDTIYAEGQRRYVESLSTYARQFLEQMEKPDVDTLDGLSPAISIEQRTTNQNPRSTVGTITEIYDYIRLLYAKMSVPFSPVSGKELKPQTIEQIVDRIFLNPDEARIQILAPIVISRKGEHAKEIEAARKAGFTKIKINNKTFDIFDDLPIDKNKKNNISIFIDRVLLKKENRARISNAVQMATGYSGGNVELDIVIAEEKPKCFVMSTVLADPESGLSFPKPEPRLFSFNSPVGACPTCSGLGYRSVFDPSLLVEDKTLSINQGALELWTGPIIPGKGNHNFETIKGVAKHFAINLDMPFYKLSEKSKNILFNGSNKEEIQFTFTGRDSNYRTKKAFAGIIADLEKQLKSADTQEEVGLEKFIIKQSCEDCHGKRLKMEALSFRIGGLNISELCELSIPDCVRFVQSIKVNERESDLISPVISEIISRLNFLEGVGLKYLSLSRSAATLSGGEMQRVRLATQIGASLRGVLYVLDEPSIGLHQRDNDKLLESLFELKNRGNSVIVVEHDRDTIEKADYVIDMGPGAGRFGGQVIFAGAGKDLTHKKDSITGKYLSELNGISYPKKRRKVDLENSIILQGCMENNLRDVTVHFPLGTLTCISGVSGSGKSSLVFDTLIPALENELHKSGHKNLKFSKIVGSDKIDKIINVDQSPIGRSPRSNPATYTGLFTQIRTLFAQTPEAQVRGYALGRFSFNAKGGRCEICEGAGSIKIEMHFLPDVFVKCHTCSGLRYNRETLAVKYKGKSIADVLGLTIADAAQFFSNIPTIEKFLHVLVDVGLGYITLGQSATSLSGGEAQRMKLARELAKRQTGKTLYVLDEPSTGLHFQDVEQLLKVLHRLVDLGNSVLVIEHNLDILKHADHIIDMGPEGGIDGGMIVAEGSPEVVAKNKKSHTAKYLAPYLK